MKKKLTGGTKGALVALLWKKPESPARNQLIQRALKGIYHDFETPHATPKINLVCELRDAGFEDLAKMTIDGEFDDEP